jgi:hypothetical protein
LNHSIWTFKADLTITWVPSQPEFSGYRNLQIRQRIFKLSASWPRMKNAAANTIESPERKKMQMALKLYLDKPA